MDTELTRNFGRAIEQVRARGIFVSPPAYVLLYTVIDAIQDSSGRPPRPENPRQLQEGVIERLPDYLLRISEHYKTELINARMVLSFMPSLMSDWCPFEDPPNY